MKKFLIIASLTLAFCTAGVGMIGRVAAIDPLKDICKTNSDPTVCKENQSGSTDNPIFGPNGILTKIMGWLVRLVAIAAVIGIVVAGATMVFSGGDSNQAATARRAIIYCLVALAIAALSQVLVSFVLKKL